MEPTSLISMGGQIAAGLGKIIAPQIASRFNKHFNPTNIDKAIQAGMTAVGEWEERLSPQELLFYFAKSDGWNNYHKYLKDVFQHPLVWAELEKPLTNEGTPDVDILVKVFLELAPEANIKLVENSLPPWVERFVAGYCREVGTYIQFQVAKENYCQQLAKSFDKVQFVGTAVPGQEVDKSGRLLEIFVMPDVREISAGLRGLEGEFFPDSDRPRQAELMREQRQRSLQGSRPGNKFLAKQLLDPQHWPKKAVLLGAPGSGKTTLMSYFAVRLPWQEPEADGLAGDGDTDWLPILIKIRDWERHSEEMNLLEYAGYFAEKNLGAKSLPVGFFEHWLERGRGLILLDGLDEVARVGKREVVVRRIESFLQQYDGNSAIVTSRPAGYRGDFFRTEEFPHYQLEPFDDEKIEEFVENWYDSRVKDPEEAGRRKESLRGAIEESDRIKLLARNPLLLTIIALIHRYQALLPKERHKLYDKAVETLLTSWDAYKEISSHKALNHVTLDDLRRLMEVLALWVHTQGSVGENEGGTLIDKEELISQLSREIKSLKAIELYQGKQEAERFLRLMRDRAGLLNEQGQDCYAFVHKTFQEYLCAQEIDYQADNEDDFEIVLDCIREHLHDAHWREVLLLLVAQQKRKKAARAIRAILKAESEYEQWLHRDLLFAGSCLAENPSYLQAADGELSGEILQGLVELEGSDRAGYEVRRSAFKILCSMKETEFQGQALELLKERDDIDEKRLLEYRAALGEKEEVLRILVARLKDEDSSVRWRAADALGELGKSSPTVVSALLELLSDEESSVRWRAADALGNLGKSSPTAVSALV
ncbi:MAG: HEAT repeat domain-containing protein, partial [Cyanobacteriota bacterium]|nr:HEAT repeat domain-containing protein [Cyanobacteriota bacterium]